MKETAIQQFAERPLYKTIIEEHGERALDLVLVVYVNFYFSEIEIMDLCSRWVPRRQSFVEKSYLVRHAADEVRHAKLFREGVERLGIDWESLDYDKYRIKDINERFVKLHTSDDELEVLIGLNLYAEGVLALEEIYQLGKTRPDVFYKFDQIYTDEKTHVRFGEVVAKRLVAESEENRLKMIEHCQWYEKHLSNYLGGELADKIQIGIDYGFLSNDYCESTKARFRQVTAELGYSSTL
ncbi:MAG TPA: hypothetical protein PKD12_07235 [Nitrospira sp.]|mgnify:CR=1 FL=1|nr:hypothetical protein [Nitrospira sp.]